MEKGLDDHMQEVCRDNHLRDKDEPLGVRHKAWVPGVDLVPTLGTGRVESGQLGTELGMMAVKAEEMLPGQQDYREHCNQEDRLDLLVPLEEVDHDLATW